MRRYSEGAAILVRFTLSVVFLWFGLNQLVDATSFMGFVPSWAYNLPVSVMTLVLFNGIFETTFGAALLLGVFVRPVAFLLALHLVGIAISVGYDDVFVRDLGLAAATFSVFLSGADDWCLDRRVHHKI